MSVLTNKNVLVIGDENSQIFNLEEGLKAHGVNIKKTTCDSVTPETIEALQVDLVLLNHLHEGQTCKNMLTSLKSAHLTKILPIFALVTDDDEKIQEVLSLGAADYLTPEEDTQSIILKIKTIFGSGDNFSSSSAIDISPIKASVSTTGIKVFVVEDDPLLRNLLAIRLEKSSFPAEFSNDGNDVVPKMKQFAPDVIILDLMLPGKSGFEILEEVKADSSLKSVPVVVFSNRDGQDDRRRAKELGAVGFYVKAMTDLSELIETIESLVK